MQMRDKATYVDRNWQDKEPSLYDELQLNEPYF